MAQEKSPTHSPADTALPSRAEDARNLASEALEEIQHGNKEEGNFLMTEAKNLDQAAAQDVLRKDGGKA